MKNPYEVLGVEDSFTDDQIKDAYRELAKKYHPDNYVDNPLSEFAQEKMAEINQAYDEIMNQRRGQGNYAGSYQQTSDFSSSGSGFADIRKMIQANRLVEAEELLDGVPLKTRDAEWYFLKGSVYYSRGWLDDAMNNFSTACRLNPNNPEYRAALNRMSWQGNGNMGGNPNGNGRYRTPNNGQPNNGCSPCSVCQGLVCADCCCECMGGDFINCC
ncbi:MAG: J domain-containing protein [Oscillospiraceae bacterium]